MLHNLTLLLAALLLAQSGRAQAQASVLPVQGKVLLPDATSLAQLEVLLQLQGGRRLVAFPLPDGTFSFPEVPTGVHTLTVEAIGLMYPTLKLDVGAARKGKVAAVVIDAQGTPPMPYPLLLRPYSRIEYFEKRQGFNLLAFLKTPYGMMAAFMLFSMFIMPKLKIDPEEYKEVMSDRERARQPTPARRRSD